MTDATPTFVNGAKDDFADTYQGIQNRQADSRLAMVMDLDGPQATNREHDFPFWESTPYFDRWIEGSAMPMEPMFAKTFNVIVHHWAKGIEWHKNHRADDQTRRLLQGASRLAESAGNLQERGFFDLMLGTNSLLPGSPTAPDGQVMYHANGVGSTDRFGVSGGNIAGTASGVTATDDILTDFYSCMATFRNMQDTKGQPLWTPDVLDQGVCVIYGSDNEQVFEQAFLQKRHLGTSASVNTTNVVQDASRDVSLWSTSRITDNDWYVFLKGAPKSTFVMNRQAINFTFALEGSNNSDSLRRNGMEFVAWDLRQGFGISTPYATVKVDN